MDTLCGNAEKYRQIQEWITKQLNSPEKLLSLNTFLFVSGNSGIGKTFSIKKICEIMNLHMIYISTHNCASSAELHDLLVKNTSSSMIQVLSNDKRSKIIIIDDFESMMAIDRTINSALLNILTNMKLRKVPIICISSVDIVKKIGIIKKKCQIIELSNPSDEELLTALKQISSSRNKQQLDKVIKTSNGNLSQCLSKLENSSDTIDENITINVLYGCDFNRDNVRRIITIDPWLIPLRFHENLISELKNKKCNIATVHLLYKGFMQDILYFDMFIHSSLHSNSIELASDYFASIIHFLYIIPVKKKSLSTTHCFTKILSYLSLQKKYAKKSYSSNFPLYQIGNYHTTIIGRNFMFFN